MRKMFRVAPEHVRKSSASEEWRQRPDNQNPEATPNLSMNFGEMLGPSESPSDSTSDPVPNTNTGNNAHNPAPVDDVCP